MSGAKRRGRLYLRCGRSSHPFQAFKINVGRQGAIGPQYNPCPPGFGHKARRESLYFRLGADFQKRAGTVGKASDDGSASKESPALAEANIFHVDSPTESLGRISGKSGQVIADPVVTADVQNVPASGFIGRGQRGQVGRPVL